jgi:predicted ester cyclase
MPQHELPTLYDAYLNCLNTRDLSTLAELVAENVEYNGEPVGLAGYRAMLERDFEAIPDLAFRRVFLVTEPPNIASRLQFDCTPKGELFGLPVNGRRVRFTENVIYVFERGKIRWVWSVIDKAAIAEQLNAGTA